MFLRHGLPGLLLGLVLLLVPGGIELFLSGFAKAQDQVVRYLTWGVAILVGLSLYVTYVDRQLRLSQIGWVVYLGALSLWEEWVFRVGLPYLPGIDSVWLSVASNALFGAMHYFTLRWKWYWCVGAFVGGMALSRQWDLHVDLLLITAYHWVATVINTPRLPRGT